MYEKAIQFRDTILNFVESNKDDIYVNAAVCVGIETIPEFYLLKINDIEKSIEPQLLGSIKDVKLYFDMNRKITDINLYDKNGNLVLDLSNFEIMDLI